MKMYRCLFPNCGRLIEKSGYCPAHQNAKSKPFANATRPNEALYKSARWQRMKKDAFERQPYCSMCGAKNTLHLHHITPPRGNEALFFDASNTMVVCAECHRLITAREIKDRRNAYKP